MDRDGNWIKKSDRSILAKQHTEYHEYYNLTGIERCVLNSKIYNSNVYYNIIPLIYEDMNIRVLDLDTVSAIYKFTLNNTDNITILNFASYHNPGGKYLEGSHAQEECLCEASYLYNILSRFKEFYKWNNQNKFNGLYMNRAIYTPNVEFNAASVNFSMFPSVITCAAPNKTPIIRYHRASLEENTKALRSRIKFVLDIAANESTDILILGAYGCGVFSQDPVEVASIFKEYLTTTHRCFKEVVFAIPKSTRNNNYEVFDMIFKELD